MKRRALEQRKLTIHTDLNVNIRELESVTNPLIRCPFFPSSGGHRQDVDSKQ